MNDLAGRFDSVPERIFNFTIKLARLVSSTPTFAMEPATPAMDGCICAACQGPGKLACSGCRLVVVSCPSYLRVQDQLLTSKQYCSRACQVAHRSEHKQWCNSSLNNSTWKPQWALQGRRPNLSDGGYKGKKYFYGNVPALDIIHLEGNEGKSYDQDMNVLFAGKIFLQHNNSAS